MLPALSIKNDGRSSNNYFFRAKNAYTHAVSSTISVSQVASFRQQDIQLFYLILLLSPNLSCWSRLSPSIFFAFNHHISSTAFLFFPAKNYTTKAHLLKLKQPRVTAASSGTTRLAMSSSSSSNDEVTKAIEAAANAALSDDTEPSTIFDKISKGEIPCNKVYEDDISLAFRDVNPQAPVHILVIPKERNGLTKLSNAVGSQKELLGHLMFVAGQVGKKECPNGFRLVINDGVDGAQSVYHMHIHVMGGRQMKWPPG